MVRRLDADGPATISALARAEGVRPQSMGATVAALEAAGLTQGRHDPDDGRQTLISLTPACRERLTQGRAARQDWLTRQIERLTPEERARLAAAADIHVVPLRTGLGVRDGLVSALAVVVLPWALFAAAWRFVRGEADHSVPDELA